MRVLLITGKGGVGKTTGSGGNRPGADRVE